MAEANLLLGKEVASEIRQKLKEDVAAIREENEAFKPGLAIVQIGDRSDSTVYIKSKVKAAEEVDTLSNKTNDDIVLDLVSDTLKYLPQRVDSTSDGLTAGLLDPRLGSVSPDRLRQMTQKKLSQDPLADHADQSVYVTVLRQEVNRFDRLLGIIHTSLSSLRLAVKGEVLMSEQLEEAYNALLCNRVPKAWEQRTNHANALGAWVDNLAKRVELLTAVWLDLVRKDKTSKSTGWSRESGVTSNTNAQPIIDGPCLATT
ncbi:Dynein heavy chain 14 [Desmophyllum pertusum]|uniref:Dynein heavy chain 14 n=1 Tax=Desmophyllum pertusum TaxID=174260 RepID=A0A9W9YUJ7_9CNID|nr:Dynein heavy chain 14 [Desmophyllum pertusum]